MASGKQYKLELLLGARTAAGYKSTIKGAQGDFSSISSSAKKAAALITGAFAAVNITGAVKDAVEVYSDYEQSLANSAATAGANGLEQEKMAKAARQAGRDTTKTAKESADALGYMALAGWDVNQSTKSLMPVLQLAESTGADLAETSDLVTDSMSALNLKTKDLPGYLDLVVKENNSANTTAGQLMKAFIKTGGAARSLGLDVKETGTALGILANNGTKAEESGRSINAMLTRMSSNDSAIKQMKSLNIDIFDKNGNFVGFEEALKRINKGIAGLSVEKQAQALKEIAGTNYYSKMIYLLEGVKKGANGAESAWDSLESKLENSDGALSEMNSKITDTSSGALQKMQSALDDAKISFAEAFNDEYVGILNDLAGGFNTASEAITEFADEHEIEIHNAFEDIKDGAGTLLEFVGAGAEFVVDNFDKIEAAAVGLGTALVVSKAGSGILGIASSLLTFGSNPVGLAITGITAGSAAIAALGAHARITHENMIEADLERHFGSISLSVEELDEIAQEIVGKDNLTKISTMLESIADTDDSLKNMNSSLKEVNKISWKLHAGFKLDKEDKQAYKSYIKDYVSSAQDVIDSQGYTVSVATKLLLGNDSKIGQENDLFFYGLDQEVNYLEGQLQKKLKKAVKNGVDINVDEEIQGLLGKINDITIGITEAENKAKLDAINLKYSGKDLDAASIKLLSEDIADYTEEVTEGATEAYQKSMATLNYRLEKGNISQKKYDKRKKKLDQGYYDVQANALSDGAQYMLRTIEQTYPEISGAIDTLQQDLTTGLNDALQSGVSANEMGGVIDDIIEDAVANTGVSDKTKGALVELIKSGLGSVWGSMEDLEDQIKENGLEVPEALSSGINSLEGLAALSGSIEDAEILLGKSINDSEEMAIAISAAKEAGAEIPESMAEEIITNTPRVSAAMQYLLSTLESDYQGKMAAKITLGMTADSVQGTRGAGLPGEVVTDGTRPNKGISTIAGTAKPQRASGASNGKKSRLHKNAKGGIYTNPILTMFAEKGPEAAIPLDGSSRAMALLQSTAGRMGMQIVEDNTYYQGLDATKRMQELYAQICGSTSNNVTNTTVSNDSSVQINYAPQIIIQGNADQETIQKAVTIGQAEFAKLLKKCEKEKKRTSFKSG